MSVLTYCTGWNRIHKAPAEILRIDKALQLHQERKAYCALVEEPGSLAVVEMCFFQAYCHVLFLDGRKRVANRYSFVEAGGERLFLEEAAVHYYNEDEDRASSGEIFRFKEDGTFTHDTGKAGGPIARKEGRMAISGNYAPVPEFGQYQSLLVRER